MRDDIDETMKDHGDDKPAKPAGNRHGRFTTARRITIGVVFVILSVSLIWHTGTGTLSAIGISSIAAVCPLGMLEAMIAGHSFMLHPLILLLAAILIALFVGKAFCAWVCPVPPLRNFFHPQKGVRAKSEGKQPGEVRMEAENPDDIEASVASVDEIKTDATSIETKVIAEGSERIELPPVGGKRDGVRLDSRHAVLAGALLSSLAFGFPVFCLICPIGLTFATFIGIWHLFQYNEVTWALIVFPAILIIEVVVLRKWCSTLCPVSALISLISSGNRTCKPQVDMHNCLRGKGIDCRECVDRCPEEVDPHSSSIPECSKCGICVEGCPAKAIEMKLLSRRDDPD